MLPEPLIPHTAWRRLTPVGFLEFAGGVFNPGAVVFDGKLRVLARGESVRLRRINLLPADMNDSAVPVWLDLDERMALAGHRTIERSTRPSRWRLEDFRLFVFRGRLYSNHAMIRRSLLHLFLPRWAGRLTRATGRPGISVVDLATGHLQLLGPVNVDLPCAPYEKNWVLFELDGELYLIYSFEPYRLLRLVDWKGLRFASVIEEPLSFHPAGCRRMSLSTNPVPYDDDYLLGACHCHDSRGVYRTWAIKIDRRTKRPVAATARPLLSGGRAAGPLPGVVYVMALTTDAHSVRAFFGEGDLACCWAEISRVELDRSFVSIER